MEELLAHEGRIKESSPSLLSLLFLAHIGSHSRSLPDTRLYDFFNSIISFMENP